MESEARYKEIGIVFSLLLILFISGCSTQDNYTIDGDSVLVDDDLVYIRATPHTLQGSGWVETEFTSKQYSGDIDFAFGFDTETIRPKKLQIYNPVNVTTEASYTCDEDYEYTFTTNPNYLICYDIVIDGNTTIESNYTIWEGSFDRGNIPTRTVYWNVTNQIDWHNWNPTTHAEFEYDGMTDWWYSTNRHVEAETTYRIRYFLDMPLNSQGKYALALKPSSKTFAQALADEQLYYLDPWWSASWLKKRVINITNSEAVNRYNETIFLTNLTPYDAGNSFDDVRIVDVDNNAEVAYELFDGNTKLRFATNITSSSTKQFEVYYDNALASAPDYSDCDVWAPCTPLWNYTGLIGMYKYEGDTNDWGGKGYNGTAGTAATYTAAGYVGGAYTYAGVDTVENLISYPVALINDIGGSMSFSVWFNTDDASNGDFFTFYKTAAGDCFNELNSGNILTRFVTTNGEQNPAQVGSGGLATQKWFNGVGVFDASGNTYKFYLNGTEDTSISTTGDMRTDLGYVATGRRITNLPFDGEIDELKIYDYARTVFPQEELVMSYGSEQQNLPSLSLHAWTPPTAYVNTTTLQCLSAATSISAGVTNISVKVFKNEVYDNTYDNTELEVIDGTIVQLSTPITGHVKGDNFTCATNVSESGIGSILENITITIGNLVPYFNESAQAWNGSHTSNVTADFNCTELDAADTVRYYVFNTSGEISTPLTIDNVTGIINSNVNSTDTGSYTYNVTCGDGTSNSSHQQFNVSISNLVPSTPTRLTPADDNYFTNLNATTLSCNATDADSDTLSWIFYNSTSVIQNSSSNSVVYNYSLGNQQSWKCKAYDGFNYSANSSTFNITPMLVQECKTGNMFLNMTFKDETTLGIMNGTLNLAMTYWRTGSDAFTFNYQNTTENGNYGVCFTPINDTIHTNLSAIYTSDGYETRTYAKTYALTNATTTQILYQLASASASGFNFYALSSAGTPISGVTVTVERQFSSVWTTILAGTTGGDGGAFFNLDGNFPHRFTFTKTGYTQLVTTITPGTQTDHTVTLGGGGEDISDDYFTDEQSFTGSITPTGNLNNSQIYDWVYTVTGTDILGCQLVLFNTTNNSNPTVISNQTGCLSGGLGGTLTASSINYTYKSMRATGYYSLNLSNPYKVFIVKDYHYLNRSYISAGTIYSSLGMLHELFSREGDDTLIEQRISELIWFILGLTIAIGTVTKLTKAELRNPGWAIFIIGLAVFAANYVGALALHLPSSHFAQYGLSYMILVALIGYWVGKKRSEASL